MSRANSPYVVGEYWLDQRRDGRAPGIWQIATARGRTVVYRSTRRRDLNEARAALDAFIDERKALRRQPAGEASVVAILVTYWREKGRKAVNADQTNRSLRTFAGFLLHDTAGVRATVTDLTPALFERFREWRMGSHAFALDWFGEAIDYASDGVAGATVQRNVNDVRAAVHHALANMRITMAPKIPDVDSRYLSPPRERVLSIDELARIAWYAAHNPPLFRFVTLMFATAVRPQAALRFDPRSQYDDVTGLIDLQPEAAPQTKKRNAVLPAIRPLRPVLRAWALDEACDTAASRKTAWRIMRRVLGLSDDVFPKTIRHTVATLLYADETVPERQIVELLGHEGKLARTTRIYAKYDPTRMRALTTALGRLWLRVSRESRKFGADHLLTTTGQGGMNTVKRRDEKC